MPLCISAYQPPAMSSLMSFMMPTDQGAGLQTFKFYPDCFLYLHLDAPPKGSEGFSDWMMGLKDWIAGAESTSQWMIYTDGAYWMEKCKGTAA